MIKFIKKILFESYHRPSAKAQHIYIFFYKFLFNSKTKIFSERLMLLKKPPNSMIYYNSFGRIVIMFLNLFWVILFNKFFEKESFVDQSNKLNDKHLRGNNESPWPVQALHFYEQNKPISKEFFNKINKDYLESNEILLNNKNFEDSDWWRSCREEFEKLFIKDKEININALENFRNNVVTKAEILKDQNYLKKSNSERMNKLKSIFLINLYHKLSENISLEVLRTTSDSFIGNNVSLNYRGQRINQRILRYAYYLSQIKRNTLLNYEEKNLFLDIGGGYGGLSRVLKNFYNTSTCVIVELPELCLLSSFFLKSNFPNKKIGTFDDFKKIERISSEDLKKFDFVILPQFFMKKFNDQIFDLIINTTSLGEMTDQMQDYYLNNIERCTKKYFYSVNRAEKRVEKYNSRGFYDFRLKKKWRSILYKFTHTYHIEFLGKRVD